MKKISTKLAVAVLFIGGVTQTALAKDVSLQTQQAVGSVSVTVTGLGVLEGDVKVGLYNSKADYKQSKDFRGVDAKANADTVRVNFENLPAGEYGIRLYHDIDGNGVFDMNKYGIPQEPYAYSNNAKGLMGPAKWKRVKFTVSVGENVLQTISLK